MQPAGSAAAAANLNHAVWAIEELWGFDRADTTTWQDAGRLLEHVKALGRCCGEHGVSLQPASALLTECGVCISMALSRFDEARYVPRNPKSAHQLIQNTSAGILSLSSGWRRHVLELSLALQDRLGAALEPASGRPSHHARLVAGTLYEYGKVLRYCGTFEPARLRLAEALEVQKAAAAEGGGDEQLAVARTLHELGVLHFKLQVTRWPHSCARNVSE